MVRRLTLAVFLISLAVFSATAQTRATAATRAIDKYVKSLEALSDSKKEPDLVMADTADTADIEADKPAWKRFESTAALEKAREEKETYTIAYSWKKNGKLAATNFTYFSPSGDWSQYVYHYFREDGSLAMVSAELRTFMDDCVIKQKFYFNPSGKRLRKTINYYDLTTDKPKKRCLGADALKFEYFASAAKLPFSALITARQ
jgi:hypothetical protein